MGHLTLQVDGNGHRQATWLELFFDLAFVTCIGQASHLLITDHSLSGFLRFACLFIPVWWIWNQFTWYASHFDNDDVYFRLFMIIGTGGAIILQGAFPHHGQLLPFIGTYIALHVALGLAWLRVVLKLPEIRPYAIFKLSGVIFGLIFWSIAIFQPEATQLYWMAGGTILQLIMPVIAWQISGATINVHGRHIFERHGLFTIIVLGESLLGLASFARNPTLGLMSEAFAIFVTIICIWWIYFDWDYDTSNLTNTRKAFAYNYGQLIIYAMLTIIASGVVCYLQNDLRGSELIIGGVAAFVLSILSINLLGGRWLWTRLAKIYLLAAVALLLIIAVKIVVLPTAIDHSNLLVFGSAGVLVTLCILQSFYCPKSIRSA